MSIIAAVGAPIATAAAVAPTAAVAAAAPRTGLARTGFVDGKTSAAVLLVMQRPDGLLRLGVGVHLDETEAFAATGLAVGDDLSALHRPELREELLKFGVGDPVGQVPDVQFLAQRAIS